MLAKGLDFDNVSLVGIMNADNMLYHPDFRAFERSFQMMTQVAGRPVDQRSKGNHTDIQPDHNTISKLLLQIMRECIKSNYNRQIYKYPPYFRIIKVTLKHRDFDKLKEGSPGCIMMQKNLNIPVLGPEEPAISRIRNEYLRTIIIKIPVNISVI
jgi:primosomal protein N' (replication factor Y)